VYNIYILLTPNWHFIVKPNLGGNMSDLQLDYEKFYRKNAKRLRSEHGLELAEINVLCGDNVRTLTTAAYKKALALIDSGFAKRALMINCVGNQRWALKLGREVAPGGRIGDSTNHHICVVGSSVGRVAKEYYTFRNMIEQGGIDLVIINAWELTSSNPRYKEELLFQLRELLMMNITVLVYSVAKVMKFEAGILMRGTLGRLSAIAASVIPAEPMYEEEETIQEHSEKLVGSEGLIHSDSIKNEKVDPYSKDIRPVARHEPALEYA
jgi:hypothetical protein